MGINARGQIVGMYFDADFNFRGFLLSGGQYTTLDVPDAAFGTTYAQAINNRGQIVGGYADTSFNWHGFLLSGGQYTLLPDPPNSTYTQPNGINDRGQIVGGYSDANGNSHGFLLSDGQYTTIDVPNSLPGSTSANGINDGGQIVGSYLVPLPPNSASSHGFLLSGGQYTTLDDPNAPPRPGGGTTPNGINALGQIVGWYRGNPYYPLMQGFLADPVHGKSAAADARSADPAAIFSDGVLPAVSLAQVMPTPGSVIHGPADLGVRVGENLGGRFNGATTAVPMVPLMTSHAGDGGHQDICIPANDLFMNHLDDLFTKEAVL
jgi:probable HAF family extracellular repeat protein